MHGADLARESKHQEEKQHYTLLLIQFFLMQIVLRKEDDSRKWVLEDRFSEDFVVPRLDASQDLSLESVHEFGKAMERDRESRVRKRVGERPSGRERERKTSLTFILFVQVLILHFTFLGKFASAT